MFFEIAGSMFLGGALLALGLLLGYMLKSGITHKEMLDYCDKHRQDMAGFANAYSELAIQMFNYSQGKIQAPSVPKFVHTEVNEMLDEMAQDLDTSLSGGNL